MRKSVFNTLLALAILVVATPVFAQQTQNKLVVATCGTLPVGVTYNAKAIKYGTVDVNGLECVPPATISGNISVVGASTSGIYSWTGSVWTQAIGDATNGLYVQGKDGANVTLGSKADAKSPATDTTAITMMQVFKQISASVQAPPSQAVTNVGTFATQSSQSGTWTMQPGNTANTTAWLVTGTGGTFPATQSGTWNVRNQDGAGNALTTNSTAYTAKFAQDTNLLGTLGTPFSTAGKVDVKAADGDVFVRQTTAANLNATVVGNGTFAVQATQSGTWTMQPGNTANTTPWLFVLRDAAGNARGVNVNSNNTLSVSVDASPLDTAVGAAVTEKPVYVGGINESSRTAITDGQKGALHFSTDQLALFSGALTSNGAAAGANRLASLPAIAYTNYANGTAYTAGRDAAATVGTDGLLWTANLPAIRPASYTASKNFAASSTTDNACIFGNGTTDVLLTQAKLSGTQTTAGIQNLAVVKRSAAESGGTAANFTVVPDYSGYSAASTTPVSYTSTGPTVGTPVGDIDDSYVGLMAAATASPDDIYIGDWKQKPIVLHGTGQGVCLNLGGAVSGGNISVVFKYIEITPITP